MQQLIDVISTAISTNATTEQKSAGVQACNTIAAALGTPAGTQLALPVPQRSPLAGVSFETLLDLAIAKLTSIANADEAGAKSAPPQPKVAKDQPGSARVGMRLPAPVTVPTSVARAASTPRPFVKQATQKQSAQRGVTSSRVSVPKKV